MIYNILNIKELKWEFQDYTKLIHFYKEIPLSFYKENSIYTEEHHILPKHMGGENTKDNLIELPWMIHILAHFLLAKQLEKIDKQASIKNLYAVRMILNQDKVENIQELKKIAEIKAIELETKNKLNCKKIYIKKEGEKTIQIFEDDLPEYEKLGWVKGRSFKAPPKGSVWVNDGKKSYQIKKEELESYLARGFQKGMFQTKRMKEYSHVSPITTKGWKWVFKEGERKLIEPKDLDEYLKDGWVLGSHKKSTKGMHRFNNGKIGIFAEECPEGFVPGLLKERKNEN